MALKKLVKKALTNPYEVIINSVLYDMEVAGREKSNIPVQHWINLIEKKLKEIKK